MAKYDVDIKYIPGKTNVVADALSRVSYMEPSTQENALPEIRVDTITSTLPANAAKLQEIREETDKDETLCHLKDVIYHGWPEFFTDCPSDLQDYWNFREDLSVEKWPRTQRPPSHHSPRVATANAEYRTSRTHGYREMSTASQRLPILARNLQRHQRVNFKLQHMHQVLKETT